MMAGVKDFKGCCDHMFSAAIAGSVRHIKRFGKMIRQRTQNHAGRSVKARLVLVVSHYVQ